MHGISGTRHQHMSDTLLKLEQMMKERGELDDSNEMHLKRKQLEQSYEDYIRLLGRLSIHILEYEELFIDIKANVVGKKLANLKKIIKPVNEYFAQLKEAIASYYGT